MSLQVWLPLTGDSRQQGLSDVTMGGSPASWTDGKLGKAATWNGNNQYVIYNNSTDFNYTNNFSVATWIKPNYTSGSTQYAFTVGRADMGGYGYGLQPISTSNLRFKFGNGNYDIPITNNEWCHVVMTVGNNKVTIYKNGVLVNSNNMPSTIPTYSDGCGLGLGCFYYGGQHSQVYPFYGSLNDFRIYDHCLSPMEVKELAKGLVLHYPLNRQGWGQENLMPNSIEMPVGSANPSTGTWRLAGSSQMTRSRVAISDAPSGASTYGFQSVGLQTGQDASCWGIDGFPRESGATYTLSAWGRIVGGSSTAAMLGFSVYSGTTLDYGGTYDKAKSSDTKYYGSGAYDYAGGQLNPNGNWTRIYRTFTSTSASDNIYIGFNTAKTGSNVTLQLCGVKLEKGDKMTPWIPNSNESMYTTLGLNSTTEYDCSGFCNNGTRTGTFTWISDAPKYKVATAITASNSKITSPRLFSKTQPLTSDYTVALWAKLDSNATQISRIYNGVCALNFQPSGPYISYSYSTSSNSTTGSSKNITTDVWLHMAMVYSQTDATITIYFDGKKHYTYTNKPTVYACEAQETLFGSNPPGLVSDVRVYATALSADDIKSLYQNEAQLDASGNVLGPIR